MKNLWMGFAAASVLFFAGAVHADALDTAKKKGCMACHALDKKVVGPGWGDIAKKYKGDAAAKQTLSESIVGGSKGKWGPVPMPGQKGKLSDEEVSAIVDYILAL